MPDILWSWRHVVVIVKIVFPKFTCLWQWPWNKCNWFLFFFWTNDLVENNLIFNVGICMYTIYKISCFPHRCSDWVIGWVSGCPIMISLLICRTYSYMDMELYSTFWELLYLPLLKVLLQTFACPASILVSIIRNKSSRTILKIIVHLLTL